MEELMKTRKLLLVVLAIVMIASVFAGCKKEEAPAAPETTEATEEEVVTPEPLPEITIPEGLAINFWHAMGGGLGETMEAVVAMFNEQNEYGITVVPILGIFAGVYLDGLDTQPVTGLDLVDVRVDENRYLDTGSVEVPGHLFDLIAVHDYIETAGGGHFFVRFRHQGADVRFIF